VTVLSTVNRIEYTGNGSTTVFAYPYRIFADTDLEVYVAGTLKSLVTHYTVSGVGSPTGGNVTFVTAPTNGASIIIIRALPQTQPADLPANDKFPSSTVEDALDKNVMLMQALDEVLDRTLKLGVTTTLDDFTMTDPTAIDTYLRIKTLSPLVAEWVTLVAVGGLGLPVSEANGGTGATTFNAARGNMGVGNQFDQDNATTTGLTWGYKAGLNPKSGAVIAAGTVALTASQTNYVELDPSAGTVSANITGFTTGRVPLRKLVTDTGAITTNTDNRNQLGTVPATTFNPIIVQVFGG